MAGSLNCRHVARRDDIIGFCDDLLAAAAYDDMGPNGLQVPGATEVTKVCTGVSAQLELFERSVAAGAQLLIAHHGLFWDFHPRALTPQMAARLKLALESDLSVAGYHLPLDGHREIGNNALICDALGFALEPTEFGVYRGRALGAVGQLEHGMAIEELVAKVEELTDRRPLVFHEGPHQVRRIGIVSGSAAELVSDAIAAGLDAFLTGEPKEHVMAEAREGKIHFIAAGHYATETFGVRRLGDLVAERFGIEHEFIDVPNPV